MEAKDHRSLGFPNLNKTAERIMEKYQKREEI